MSSFVSHRVRNVTFLRSSGLLGVAGGLLVWAGVGTGTAVRATRNGGDARLVSIQPLPEMEGQMCEFIPASTTTSLGMALQEQRAEAAMDQPRPSDAAKLEAAQRRPARIIKDQSAGFSAVALDLSHDEVVLQDENNFGIMVYNRTEDTPPSAKMSEPKRWIRGEETHLEFNCSLYIDPKNGDIYSVNNDTLNLMTIFSHDANGNAEPKRVLKAAYVYGIAVDEERQEMFISAQSGTIAVYHKDAKDDDKPIRFIQGNNTKLADPHGMAIDEKRGLIFVTNWGTTNKMRPPAPSDIPWGDGRRWGAQGESGGGGVPGSGTIEPPSITVYPKDAMGDAAPLRVIQGPKTRMNWPSAIAIDSEHGEMFVANDTGDSVTVYNIEAHGDVAPIRVLAGPKSMVKNPTGVAYDPKHDELWVANFGNHSATVFKRTASGDTPPLRMIRASLPGEPAPMMGNPHMVNYNPNRDELIVAT